MKESCTIKSNSYGLTLLLNPDVEFEQLVKDICVKFLSSRDFFRSAELIISFQGRELSMDEMNIIVEAIELNSDIKIKFIYEEDKLKDIRMKKMMDQFFYDNIYDNAKIVMGSVRNEDYVFSNSSLIVLGDVKKKATVKANGNIIIMGTLEGTAIAGFDSDDSCYIVAEKILADQVMIGAHQGEVSYKKKSGIFSKKDSTSAVAVVVWDDKLYCEQLNNGILKENGKNYVS